MSDIPTLDPLLAAWLPQRSYWGSEQRGTEGPQSIISEGDPDVWVEPAERDGWVRVWWSSRGNRRPRPEIEGRFDIVQRWIAWYAAPASDARTRDGDPDRPTVPSLVPAPDTAFAAREAEDHTTLLLERGEPVARLADHSPRGALIPHTPETNKLTHIAYWPLPFLLQQLDLTAQLERGGIFRRWSERWPPRTFALTERAKWDRALVQSQQEAERLRAAVREATGL